MTVGRSTEPVAQFEGRPPSRGHVATVTVVLTTYRDTDFLASALSSVDRQSRPADAVIVVDDGSPDDPRSVLQRFPGVHYHRQTNMGLGAARNAGLGLVTTDAVTFLDADDELLPNALAAGVDAFARDPGAVFVCGGHRIVDVAGKVIGDERPPPEQLTYADLLYGNQIGMHAAVLYRTTAIRAVGGFDPNLRRCEDYDLYLRLARGGTISTYPEIVADYRHHGGNMSADSAVMLDWALEVHGRQRRHVLDDPTLLRAWEAGRTAWRSCYAPNALSTRAAAACPRSIGRLLDRCRRPLT